MKFVFSYQLAGEQYQTTIHADKRNAAIAMLKRTSPGATTIKNAMSVRKPYNENAGYIASKQFTTTNGGKSHIVIYKADEQGIDVGGNKYAVVCETHHTMVGVTSVPKARSAMKMPDFCQDCFPEEP